MESEPGDLFVQTYLPLRSGKIVDFRIHEMNLPYDHTIILDNNLAFEALLGSTEETAAFPTAELVLSPSFSSIHLDRLIQIRTILESGKDYGQEEKGLLVAEWTSEVVTAYLQTRLRDGESAEVPVVFDILSILAVYDLSNARAKFAGSNNEMKLLIECTKIVQRPDTSESVTLHFTELFRHLLEPSLGGDTFIGNMYEAQFIDTLCQPLLDHMEDPGREVNAVLIHHILDVLCFCVCSHHCIGKAYFLRFGSLFKAMRSILLREASPSFKLVILATIRLVRAFLWQKDPQYLRCLSAFNIPSLILQLVYLHRPRGLIDGTMVYSAALEILTFICVNNQTTVIESLCRPQSESEEIVRLLAQDEENRSHCELAVFMLSTMQRLTNQLLLSGGAYEDMNSRHSIGSSRGRSPSPHPLVVPMPGRKRTLFEDVDEEIIPKTPGGSPTSPQMLRRRNSDAEADLQPPAIMPSPDSQLLKRARRFSTDNSL